jgi:hypothetical protein
VIVSRLEKLLADLDEDQPDTDDLYSAIDELERVAEEETDLEIIDEAIAAVTEARNDVVRWRRAYDVKVQRVLLDFERKLTKAWAADRRVLDEAMKDAATAIDAIDRSDYED